jgi:hypothetical protein
MMNLQLENVIEKGTTHTYQLVLADDGLYLVYTGDTQGREDFSGTTADWLHVIKHDAQEIAESLDEGTEELGDDSITEAALNNTHGVYINFPKIDFVTLDERSREIKLRTARGNYDLEAVNEPLDRVQAFVKALDEAVDLERQVREDTEG